jgi:hypothetical protein
MIQSIDMPESRQEALQMIDAEQDAFLQAFCETAEHCATMTWDDIDRELTEADKQLDAAILGTPTGKLVPAHTMTMGDPNYTEEQFLADCQAEHQDITGEPLEDIPLDRLKLYFPRFADQLYRTIEISEYGEPVFDCDDLERYRRKGRWEALDVANEAWNNGIVADWPERAIHHSIKRWGAEKAYGVPDVIRAKKGDPISLDYLLEVPGLIGDVLRHNLATAKRPQPMLALAGAAALQATIIGRKVKDEYGTHPNLQLICVAGTGKGKDHARQVNANILTQSQCEQLLGPEEVSSDAGLYTALYENPSMLWQADEFGRFLQTTKSAGRSPWLYAVISALLKLYSSAGKLFAPKAYAVSKGNIVIDQPHLVLLGTTTPQALYSGLSSDAIGDGFLGRCLIFEGDHKPPRQMKPEQPIPESILEVVAYWRDFHGGGNLDQEHPKPLVVKTTDDAGDIFEELATTAEENEQAGGKGAVVWTRAEQKARQLALVYACSEDPQQPLIDKDAALWACDLVCHLTDRMVTLAGDWISENQHEADGQRVIRILKAAKNGRITLTELARKMRHTDSKQRATLVKDLMEAGLVRMTADGKTSYLELP